MMPMGMRAIRSFLPVGFDTASILSFPHQRVSLSSLICPEVALVVTCAPFNTESIEENSFNTESIEEKLKKIGAEVVC
jgi:hypothetical protein